jgi:iron complex outermembrane receptor protein
MSIRGSTAEQVVVLLDGIPLNTALGGGVNLGTLPLSNVESIEIYRSSSPNRFGVTGIGGVVNIKTKRARGTKDLLFQTHYGSFETFGINNFLGHKPGAIDYSIGLEYVQSENDFEFINDRGTPFNPDDDRRERRENNDYRGFDGTFRWGYDYGTFRLDVVDNFHISEQGLAGPIGALAKEARFSETRNLITPKGEYLTEKGLKINFEPFYSYRLSELEDRKGEVGTGRQDTHDVFQNIGAQTILEYALGRYQLPSLLARYSRESFSPKDELSSVFVPSSKRTTSTLGLQNDILLFDERLLLVPSLKYDHVANDFAGETLIGKFEESVNKKRFDKLTRQFGAKLTPFPFLSLKGNIGVFYRFPSFFELFGNNGRVLGNPDLGPEKGFNRDVGLAFNWRHNDLPFGFSFETIYFNNDVEDLIVLEQATGQIARPRNVDDANIKGWEFVIRAQASKHFRLAANVTYQDSINRGPTKGKRGNRIPRTPLIQSYMDATFAWKYFELSYEFETMIDAYLDLANLAPAKDRFFHNLSLKYKPWENVTATFQVKNLTDELVEDFFNFPLPGRSFYFTVTISDFSVFSKLFKR